MANTLSQKMNSYNQEQFDAIGMIQKHLATIDSVGKQKMMDQIAHYLCFREDVARFMAVYFGEICTQKCYLSKVSACCTREGIITFFADVVINALVSKSSEIELLKGALQNSDNGNKCVYLGNSGCIWNLKPIICEMFLCEQAKAEVFAVNSAAGKEWKQLKEQEKRFRWPDRPVLFDLLEQNFIEAGFSSPLMYLHLSPGLLRLKRLSESTGK